MDVSQAETLGKGTRAVHAQAKLKRSGNNRKVRNPQPVRILMIRRPVSMVLATHAVPRYVPVAPLEAVQGVSCGMERLDGRWLPVERRLGAHGGRRTNCPRWKGWPVGAVDDARPDRWVSVSFSTL